LSIVQLVAANFTIANDETAKIETASSVVNLFSVFILLFSLDFSLSDVSQTQCLHLSFHLILN